MVDTNFVKSQPGLLMLLSIVGCSVAIGCICASSRVNYENKPEHSYILAAPCVTLAFMVIFFIIILIEKLSDQRLLLGALFLCGVLMIIDVILVATSLNFFDVLNVACAAIIITTIIIVVLILVKLGLIKE